MKHLLTSVLGTLFLAWGFAACADYADPAVPAGTNGALELCAGNCGAPPPPSPFDVCMQSKGNLPAASMFGQCVSCCQHTCTDAPCANTCAQQKCVAYKTTGKGR